MAAQIEMDFEQWRPFLVTEKDEDRYWKALKSDEEFEILFEDGQVCRAYWRDDGCRSSVYCLNRVSGEDVVIPGWWSIFGSTASVKGWRPIKK